jgi:agmatine deiminase
MDRQNKPNGQISSIMITDSQTNFLHLADTLPTKYPDFYKRFKKVLTDCNINFALLPNTKDVWAVDYMPIQTELDKFVRFVYNPSYLQTKKLLKTISDVDKICNEIGVNTFKTDIILDGGNVTRWKNKVVMTDRVFKDNPTYERKQLIKQLYELFQIDKLYFVPEQPSDFTGHSDGMVRFIDENTVVINDYSQDKEWFHRAFEIAIHNTGLNYIKIPYNVYNNNSINQANGDYINYLQMENAIIIPTFGIKEDDEAIKQLETIFAGQTISTIDSNEIANDGGILNCITWNIKINEQRKNSR